MQLDDLFAHVTRLDAATTIPTPERAVLLARSGLLDPGPDSELDQWTYALRRATGAAVVAVSIEGPAGTRIKGLWVFDQSDAQTTALTAGQTFESFLTGSVRAPGDHPRSYLERSVIVDGHV